MVCLFFLRLGVCVGGRCRRCCLTVVPCLFDGVFSLCFFSLLFAGVRNEDPSYHTNNCQFYQAPQDVQKMTDEIVGNLRDSVL